MGGGRRFCTPQRIVFAIWAGAAILAGSILTSFHEPFNPPSNRVTSLATELHGWRALHLLTDGCGCSNRLSHYLVKRGRIEELSEEVIFAGPEDPFGVRSELESRGFRVRSETVERLRAVGVTGVPLLLILSPGGEVKYMGGYGAGGYEDREIWAKVQSGAVVARLPVIGCAVGSDLRRRIDPLAWK